MTSGPMTLREEYPHYDGTLNLTYNLQDKENFTRNSNQVTSSIGRSSSTDIKSGKPPASRHFYNLSSQFQSRKMVDLN